MKPQNNNYWSGFGLGLLGGAGLMYILGTKKGRTALRTFLSNTDDLEHSVEDIISFITKSLPQSDSSSNQGDGEQTSANGIDGVMSKIRGLKLPKKGK